MRKSVSRVNTRQSRCNSLNQAHKRRIGEGHGDVAVGADEFAQSLAFVIEFQTDGEHARFRERKKFVSVKAVAAQQEGRLGQYGFAGQEGDGKSCDLANRPSRAPACPGQLAQRARRYRR